MEEFVSKAVVKFIPVKTIKDTNSPPLIDGGVRHLILKKYAALRKFRESKTVERKLKLRTATQNVKSLIKRKHREYLAKVEDSLSSNPKHFWSYHKAILHHRTSPSTIIAYDGATAKTASEKANLFNQYFSSTFSQPSTANVNEVTSSHSFPLKTDILLSNITLCIEKVSDCLNSLDTTKACGQTGYPLGQVFVPSSATLSFAVAFLPSGNPPTSRLSTRKTAKNQPKIIELFPC